MSFKVVGHVLEHSEAKYGPRLVMIAIAEYAHDDGSNAFPSIKTLAKKAKLTRRQVCRALRVLADELGEIAIGEGHGPHGVNVYRVTLPGLSGEGQIVTPQDKCDIRGGDICDRPQGQIVTPQDKCDIRGGDICDRPQGQIVTQSHQDPLNKEKREDRPVVAMGATGSERDEESWMRFWRAYPPRDGKKVKQAETQRLFCLLSPADQELAAKAAEHYAQSRRVLEGIGIRDPKRFLRDGKGHEPWRDWIEPEVTQADPARSVVELAMRATTCVGTRPDGYHLRPCGQPIAESERGKKNPLCPACIADRKRWEERQPEESATSMMHEAS